MTRPNANGSTMPNPPIEIAARTCLALPSGARSSAPTMNMNRLTPSVPSPESIGSEAAGNTAACTCGAQAPNTSGPSTRPAAISPITGGWPTWRNAAPQSFADASTSTSCSNSSSIGLTPIPARGRRRSGRSGRDPCGRRPDSLRRLQHVDEAVDRQAPGMDVRRRNAGAVDVARMQHVAPVDHDAVVDAFDAVDLFEQGGISVDIPHARRVFAPALLLQALVVGLMPRGVDGLEPGGAVTVEGGAAPVAAEQIVDRGQAIGLHRIDVRDPLQEAQPLRRQRHQRVVAGRKGEPPLRRQPEVLGQQRPD